MRKPQAIIIGTAGLATAFAVSACGSSTTTTTTTDATPTEAQSFSLGDDTVNTGGSLPSYWPSDVPTPNGLNYVGGAQLQGSVSGGFNGSTPIPEVTKQLDADFKAQGWTANGNFGGGDSGGVTSWQKGSQTAQVIIASEKGTTVNITVVNT